MEKVCLLRSEYNTCQYHMEGQKCCAPHNSCGMLVKLDSKSETPKYVRKPRWYEQYIKTNK